MSLTSPPKHVVIVGAGLSGLSLALALQKVGIPCSIYEARSESYSIGGGITLSPNGLRILEKFGVYPRVKQRGFHFETLAFKNDAGETTDVYYFGSKKLYGYRAFRITRQLMIDEMKKMLSEQGIQIHHNMCFSQVISETLEQVEIKFADESTAYASILIGSDGIYSSVRKYVVPSVNPVYSGITAINGVIPRSRMRIPEGYHLPATVMAKPGAFLLVPQEPDGLELLIGAQRRFPDRDKEGWKKLRDNKQELLNMLRESQQDWPDIVQSVLEEAPVEKMGIWPFYGMPKLEKWASASDRVIIVGDAAHAIPPTAGQGVNQAFEDVNMLAILLSKLSSNIALPNALQFWQSYRQERVDKIMELTKQMNAKRLPPSEQAKLPPGAIWVDEAATRGEGGQLTWLYKTDLDHDVAQWIAMREAL